MAATVDHAQSDFSGGEISPRLHGRFESPLYRKALAYARNFQVTRHGSLLRRNGTEYICALQDSTEYRLVPFKTSKGDRYVVGLGDSKIRIFDESGEVSAGAGAGGLVTNGTFDSGETGWTKVLDGGYGVAYVAGGHAVVGAQGVRDGEGAYEYFFGTFKQDVVVADPGTYRFVFRSTTASRLLVSVTGGVTGYLNVAVTASGTYTYDLELLAGTYTLWFTVETNVVCGFDDVQFFKTGSMAAISSPWTKAQVGQVQFVMLTASDTLILVHPNVAPRSLVRNGDGTWTLATIAFTNAPGEWTGTNYPGVVELFQSRLWFAATPAQQNWIWASRSNSLYDFRQFTDASTSTPSAGPADEATRIVITADCALVAKLAVKGRIQWLRGRSMLLVGTDIGEGSITAQTGVPSPTDFQYRDESAFGSTGVQAIDVGDLALYVARDSRKIRGLRYAFESQSWNSTDLTFVVDHLTEERVREIHFARDPNVAIVALLGNGQLACCTFDRAQELAAWWRLEVEEAVIRSACVLDGTDGSTLWMSVVRANGVFLEKVTLEGDGPVQLDAQVTKVIPVSKVITGLNHLEGELVGIIIDGVVQPSQTVASNEVTLETAGASVTIGLPYTSEANTLVPTAEKSAAQRRVRRWVEASLVLNDSALPLVNGVRTPDRAIGGGRGSGDFGPIRSAANWEAQAILKLSQDLPLRTEVLAVYGVLQEGEV